MLPFILITEISEEFCLYKNGLQLLESGKKILANNFIVNLIKKIFFLDAHTHHPPIFL